jgi:hypothetical protein
MRFSEFNPLDNKNGFRMVVIKEGGE